MGENLPLRGKKTITKIYFEGSIANIPSMKTVSKSVFA